MPVVYVDEGGYRKPIEVGADRFRELVGLDAPGGGVQDAFTRMVMGGVMRSAPGADPRYQSPPASETWKRALSMGVDFAPGVGDVKALQEAASGQNLITGEKLGGWERALSGAGALPFLPNVAGLMAGKNALKAPLGKVRNISKFIDETTTDTSHWDGLLKRGEAEIVRMSPDDYLSKVAQQQGVSLERTLSMVPEDLPKEYADRMLKGEKAPLPILDYVENTQEGRARALAAKLLGEKEIPVLVRGGKQQPKSGLSLAEDLAAKGADADEIWNKTGWRSDPKWNWAFEIDDSKMTLKVKEIPRLKDVFLEDIIDHPTLFENYPQLRQIKVTRSSTMNAYGDGEIYLKDFDKEHLIHELQHPIQEIEGWPIGGSSTKATPELMSESKAKTPFEWYKRHFGEFQARDAASRANWDAEARKTVRPYSSEMEPKEGWIYRK